MFPENSFSAGSISLPRRGFASWLGLGIGLVVWWLAAVAGLAAEPAPPPGGEAAATMALKRFLPLLDTAKMKETHGFEASDDLKGVKVSAPFEPLILRQDQLGKYAGGKVADLLVPSGTFYFSIQSRERVACLIVLQRKPDGTWQDDSLGMRELARAWAAIRAAWPPEKNYSPRLVIVPSHQRFYFTVPEAPEPNLTRLDIYAPGAAVPATYEKLINAAQAFEELQR